MNSTEIKDFFSTKEKLIKAFEDMDEKIFNIIDENELKYLSKSRNPIPMEVDNCYFTLEDYCNEPSVIVHGHGYYDSEPFEDEYSLPLRYFDMSDEELTEEYKAENAVKKHVREQARAIWGQQEELTKAIITNEIREKMNKYGISIDDICSKEN